MRQRIDSLAQQVEHNTFNVGVLGSSPKRITRRERHIKWLSLFVLVVSVIGFLAGELKIIVPFFCVI